MCSTPLTTVGTGIPVGVLGESETPTEDAPAPFDAVCVVEEAAPARLCAGVDPVGRAEETALEVAGDALDESRELSSSVAAAKPFAPRWARPVINREAAMARASSDCAQTAAPAASSPSRSVKYRCALAPGRTGAASRNVVNDIPALQFGFEGSAGKRAARSARCATARINPIARSTTSPFSG